MDTTQPSDSDQDIHILQPLMRDRGVITMPYELRYDDFREVEQALDWVSLNYNHRPIVKFLGVGGDYTCATALGEMFRDHDAIGVMVGGSYSGHTISFMMCNERYIYPTAYLGVHSSSIMPNERPYTRDDFMIEAEIHEHFDDTIAQLFADNCNDGKFHGVDFWRRFHSDARTSIKLIASEEAVEYYGLAKYVDDMDEVSRFRLGKRRK